ncbi:MAG TPA: NUDIX domain-containing protein [Candidatus Faecousia faecipullorum]|nr:NUDIX domain-containing protein [Candidatus Faecousia faecipullorum]
MDITYISGDNKFNYRVCGILLHEHKILAMQDACSPYYYLPGGRVKLGETAEEAVQRELKEELGISVKIQRPLWLNQAFFTEDVDHLHYHELCVYFLMDSSERSLLQKGEAFSVQEGERVLKFRWLPLESLETEYFYPLFLKKEIFHLPDHFTIRTEWE